MPAGAFCWPSVLRLVTLVSPVPAAALPPDFFRRQRFAIQKSGHQVPS